MKVGEVFFSRWMGRERQRERGQEAGGEERKKARQCICNGGLRLCCSAPLVWKFMQNFKQSHQMWTPCMAHDIYEGGWMVLCGPHCSGINLIGIIFFSFFLVRGFEIHTWLPLILGNIETFSILSRQIVATPTGPLKLVLRTRHRKKLWVKNVYILFSGKMMIGSTLMSTSSVAQTLFFRDAWWEVLQLEGLALNLQY